MGIGAPEIITIILVLTILVSPIVCAIVGYQFGCKRRIGGVAGLFLGLFLHFIGLIIVFTSGKIEEDIFATYTSPAYADELKKYKDLFDLGAITQQEYNQQKSKIPARS